MHPELNALLYHRLETVPLGNCLEQIQIQRQLSRALLQIQDPGTHFIRPDLIDLTQILDLILPDPGTQQDLLSLLHAQNRPDVIHVLSANPADPVFRINVRLINKKTMHDNSTKDAAAISPAAASSLLFLFIL